MKNASNDYVTRVLASPSEAAASEWNALVAAGGGSPFVRHEYLAALHDSGSAVAGTGWNARFLTLWRDGQLHAACPLYLKDHSYGEYVFDWAWANAYEQHGLAYYPKGLVAVPFTPVPGPRLLARDSAARAALLKALLAFCEAERLSSLHVLFAAGEDVAACEEAGLMLRHTVQFHWTNAGWASASENAVGWTTTVGWGGSTRPWASSRTAKLSRTWMSSSTSVRDSSSYRTRKRLEVDSVQVPKRWWCERAP